VYMYARLYLTYCQRNTHAYMHPVHMYKCTMHTHHALYMKEGNSKISLTSGSFWYFMIAIGPFCAYTQTRHTHTHTHTLRHRHRHTHRDKDTDIDTKKHSHKKNRDKDTDIDTKKHSHKKTFSRSRKGSAHYRPASLPPQRTDLQNTRTHTRARAHTHTHTHIHTHPHTSTHTYTHNLLHIHKDLHHL